MRLRQISRILVKFCPTQGNNASVREFLARISSSKARASNPDCKVSHKLLNRGEPTIEIEFDNNQSQVIATKDLSIKQILSLVESKAEEMDTANKLKAAGFQGQQLTSNWSAGNGRSKSEGLGSVHKIPRQQ